MFSHMAPTLLVPPRQPALADRRCTMHGGTTMGPLMARVMSWAACCTFQRVVGRWSKGWQVRGVCVRWSRGWGWLALALQRLQIASTCRMLLPCSQASGQQLKCSGFGCTPEKRIETPVCTALATPGCTADVVKHKGKLHFLQGQPIQPRPLPGSCVAFTLNGQLQVCVCECCVGVGWGYTRSLV